MERLKNSHDITVTWHAYELRPQGSPPIPEWYMERIKQSRPRLEAIARDVYYIDINSGPFGINSRPAMIGAKYADTQDKGYEYNQAMLRAYWQEGKDISDLTVMQDVARSVGLDVDEYTAALGNSEFEALVDADIALAKAYEPYGMNGVPALVFNVNIERKILVMGAQPYDELVRVIEQITQRFGDEMDGENT